jgi:ribonuclease HII
MIAREDALQRAGYQRVAGVDEAGRGPLAGPVVAAAVVLRRALADACAATAWLASIFDSKQLSASRRSALCDALMHGDSPFHISIGMASVDEIDRLNILCATQTAMRRALGGLVVLPDYVLVDGNRPIPHLDLVQECVVKGDARCLSVAAASIVAKVTRDRLMCEYATLYPEYGFAEHKGYGTARHLRALREHGHCPLHRRSFTVRAVAAELF